jgi:hypothetical protein
LIHCLNSFELDAENQRRNEMRGSLPARISSYGFVAGLIALTVFVGAGVFAGSKDEAVAAGDPWTADSLIQPEDLAKRLSEPAAKKPVILQIGVQYLYHTAHIAGSSFAGTASNPEGIEKLKEDARNLPRDAEIVLYCGCCPWNVCPNTRPAFKALQELGFKNLKVLYLAQNLQRDWIQKGFPTVRRTG